MLLLSPDQIRRIQTHAESTYPEECCGLLLGRLTSPQHSTTTAAPGSIDRNSEPAIVTVTDVWPTANTWTPAVEHDISTALAHPVETRSTKLNRYWIDPRDMLKAQQSARDRQLAVVGVYHSHTDHPAVPSECDRRLAWSGYSYLIVSVYQGCAQDSLSWRLNDQHQFQPETIHTHSSTAASADSRA